MSLILPQSTRTVDLASFGIYQDVVGADDNSLGRNDNRDVLITETVDGYNLNTLYQEFQQTIALQNAERQRIIDFLTFEVAGPSESVQQLSSARFERATEYGEPKGIRQQPKRFSLGYDFQWYDLAIRYTWQFLANATAAQVQAFNSAALDADNRLIFTTVLEALYTNENREATIDGREYSVYSLYNGDGTVPPSYKSNTFDGTHNHYLVSGAATVTPGDLDDLYEHLRHHGYGAENGVQQLVLVNSREGKEIRKFRVADGATYDFIPAQGQPYGLILDPGQTVVGTRAGATFEGLNVIGTYGYQLIIEDDLFPAGYVTNIGSGGESNLNNPVGIREHENASLRGLKLVKGPDNDYPLIESFYNRGLGTGIRQRGGSAVMQIKATGTYTPPAEYIAY
jgi:hypothetical protein